MSVNCNVCGCYFDGPHAMDTSGEAMHESIVDCLAALRAEVERLTRERDEAREALAPFAEYALALEDRFGRESVLPAGAKIGHPGPVLCVMDFRRAYRAYAVGGVSGTAGTGTIGDSFTEKSSRDATVSIDGASQPQGGSDA